MNSPFVLAQASALVQRVAAESAKDPVARIHHLYNLLYSRGAQRKEVELARAYVGESKERWVQYAQALLGANEMMMID